MEGTMTEGQQSTETPTPSEPEGAPSKTKERQAAGLVLLTELGSRFPKLFRREWNSPPLPMKIGLHTDLQALFPEIDSRTVREALRQYTMRCGWLYQEAVAKGGPRYDLEGNPQGEVTPAEQELAEKALAQWRQKREQRQQAAKEVAQKQKAATPPATVVNGGKPAGPGEGKKPVAKSPAGGERAGDRAGGPPPTSTAGKVDPPRPVQPRPQPAPKVTPPTAKEAATILMQGRTERVAPRVLPTKLQTTSAPRVPPRSAPSMTTTVAVVTRKKKAGK
jgi:sRNA-binding protein